MHRTSTMRLLAAAIGTFALATPAMATSVAVQADCGFQTFADETVTGGFETYTGVAYGYAMSDTPGASISVSCEVRVNGGTVASTPSGPSGQLGTTTGQVTYTAAESDTVTLCAVWTGSESGEACGLTVSQQFPPQEVNDLLNLALNRSIDLNVGDTGFVEQSVSETASALMASSGKSGSFLAPPGSHDLSTGCTYKYEKNTGFLQINGRTHAGRHPVATTTSIRCRVTAGGTVLYDQTRTEPGTIARINDAVFVGFNPNNTVICNAGQGWWDDGDTVSAALTCGSSPVTSSK